MKRAAFALEVAVGVDARCRRMAAVGFLQTLIYIGTIVVFHLIARLALTVVPRKVTFRQFSGDLDDSRTIPAC